MVRELARAAGGVVLESFLLSSDPHFQWEENHDLCCVFFQILPELHLILTPFTQPPYSASLLRLPTQPPY